MRAFTRILPVVLLLGIGTAIYADDSAPVLPAAEEKPATQRMTPAQIKARADVVGVELEDDYQAVLKLKAVANKKKDVIKLNCVNDRLIQLKAEMNVGSNTRASIKSTDEPGALQELHRDLQNVSTSAKKLREEASACIGEVELYKQESGVDVKHPDFPDDPGTVDPTDPTNEGVDVEPPGYASPYN